MNSTYDRNGDVIINGFNTINAETVFAYLYGRVPDYEKWKEDPLFIGFRDGYERISEGDKIKLEDGDQKWLEDGEAWTRFARRVLRGESEQKRETKQERYERGYNRGRNERSQPSERLRVFLS